MVILLFGPPGCGKGTQAVSMARSMGVPSISTGEIFRAECKAGTKIGKSLAEHDMAGEANAIFDRAEEAGCTIHLPFDVVVAKEFAANPPGVRTCNVHEVAADEMILDIGPACGRQRPSSSRGG